MKLTEKSLLRPKIMLMKAQHFMTLDLCFSQAGDSVPNYTSLGNAGL